ncbi:hypothetical protein BCR41DRAFT_351575 [Lobosporangium transversale]|uniref:Uncharacterized protein n=1 Tax=Lobosporangium transversale TaxID=64571 RepID=A0A1Y2GUL9_9FUNG|nr:hypothetical protein BCR41DRAFT_351575 [Lobosporangium transversale]ORZ19121.1 hypothetical protein BCR41DRAFT_351575 [Lobosporangium transversale]|eukprot:XP_021882289.1 hypothetical protein BCR41DRAFT_351575 [Lobosporangium transversale]
MSNQSSHDVFEAAASGDLEMIKGLGRIHLEAKNDRGWTPVAIVSVLHLSSFFLSPSFLFPLSSFLLHSSFSFY